MPAFVFFEALLVKGVNTFHPGVGKSSTLGRLPANPTDFGQKTQQRLCCQNPAIQLLRM
jgi:hypothetical protein